MTPPEFDIQMRRVLSTFDTKTYSKERLALIWGAVSDLSAHSLSRIVDHLLATSRYAPLPKDFSEAAYAERKSAFDRTVREAASPRNWQNGLSAYLTKTYGSECKTLTHAVEMQIEKNKIKRALEGE